MFIAPLPLHYFRSLALAASVPFASPSSLLVDFDDAAGAHGTTTLTNREP
jgi:hypothetical protein